MESRLHYRRWLLYLVILATAAGFLLAFDERSFPVPDDSPLASLIKSERPKERNSENAPALDSVVKTLGSKTLTSSRDGLSVWLDSDQWRAGAARYLEIAVASDGKRWAAPPAGRVVAAEIRALQDAAQAKASNRTYQSVGVELKGSTPPTASFDYVLSIDSQGRNFRIDLPAQHAVIEPLMLGAGQLAVSLIERKRGWFHWGPKEQPVTDVATLPVADLRPGGASRPLTLAPLKKADTQIGLALRLTGGPTDVNKFNRGIPGKPAIINLEEGRVTLEQGHVSLEQLHARDELFLKRSNHYTAIVVLGSTELRGRVWCERDDDGRKIGVYAADVPLMAAMANAWSSLRVTVRVDQPGEMLKYQVLAISSRNPPGRELVLEIVGRHLPELQVDGRPVNGPSMRRSVKWLAQALDARFTPEDARATDAPEVRALIAHLAGLTEAEPSPGGAQKADKLP